MDSIKIQSLETIQDYKVISLLDQGSQAWYNLLQCSIYKATKNGLMFAIKVYRSYDSAFQDYQREVACLQKLSSVRLVTMVESFDKATVTTPQEQLTFSCIVLQFVQGGDLHFYIQKDPIPQCYARSIFKELLSVLIYLDSAGVYHRDIKPANILFDCQYHVKLADFGLAQFRDKPEHKHIGTINFMAPELIRYKTATVHSQIFSLGVTLFVMVVGIYPFQQAKYTDLSYRCVMENNFKKFWKRIEAQGTQVQMPSESFQKLFESLVRWDIKHRATFDTILQSSWVNEKDVSRQNLQFYMTNRKRCLMSDKTTDEHFPSDKEDFSEFTWKLCWEI